LIKIKDFFPVDSDLQDIFQLHWSLIFFPVCVVIEVIATPRLSKDLCPARRALFLSSSALWKEANLPIHQGHYVPPKSSRKPNSGFFRNELANTEASQETI
jgi:hypothetical protein